MKKLVSFLLVITVVLIAGGCDFNGETAQGKLTSASAKCPGTWTKIFQVKGDMTPDRSQIIFGSFSHVKKGVQNGCDFKTEFENTDHGITNIQSFICSEMLTNQQNEINSFDCKGQLAITSGEGDTANRAGHRFFYKESVGGVVNFLIVEVYGIGGENPHIGNFNNTGNATLFYR